MTRLQTLRARALSLHTQMQARLDAAVENGEPRVFTEDEQTAHDGDQRNLDAFTTQIEAEERHAVVTPPEPTPDEPPEPQAHVTHEPGDEPFADIGEQMRAIVRMSNPSNPVQDDRQVRVEREARAASGLSEAVPADGGFQIQKDFVAEIKGRMHDGGQILQRVNRTPISAGSNGLKFNVIKENSRVDGSRAGGVRGYWADEAATVTKSQPELRQVELTLSKLMGLMYATDELLADGPALAARAMRDFSDELRFKTEDAFFRGDGAGKPTGILDHGGTIDVAKESGQAATTIVFENIQKMWSRCLNRSNSVWMINQDTEPELNNMSIAVGTGGHAVYLPAGGLSVAPFATLMGRPVIPVEFCSTLGTSGDIVLADWSAYEMIDKGTPQADTSMHVRFLYGEETFRITYRVDGQPVFNSALTPYQGSTTQAHFLTLADRS